MRFNETNHENMAAKQQLNLICIVRRVECLCGIQLTRKDLFVISRCLGELNHLVKHRGAHGVKAWKRKSDSMIRWVIGSEMDPHWRFPLRFHWARKGRRNQSWRVFTLTVLSFHRYFLGGQDIDITTITNPATSDWVGRIPSHLWDVPSSFRSLAQRAYEPWPEPLPVLSNKAGPNGSPGWAYADVDRKALRNEGLWWDLLEYVRINTSYSPWIFKSFIKLGQTAGNFPRGREEVTGKPRKGPTSCSRLAFIGDKSGKTRVVAIGDVWSQMVLKPLHDHVFRVLRKIPMDGTHDQDSMRHQIKKWSSEGRMLFSYDLTAATDRFPATFQAEVLSRMGFLAPGTTHLWLRLMTHRKFRVSYQTRGQTKTKHKFVKYAVGQPMGLYSSWASLAISHHIIVQMAAKLSGSPLKKVGELQWFCDYAILGDDIVIADSKVALHYLDIMEALGVSISLSKSWIGKGIAEFAKSLYLNGVLTSSLPLGVLTLRRGYFTSDVALSIDACMDRNIELSWPQILKSFKPISRRLLGKLFWSVTSPCLVNRFSCPILYGRDESWWRWAVSFEQQWSRHVRFLRSLPSLISSPLYSRPMPFGDYPGSPLLRVKMEFMMNPNLERVGKLKGQSLQANFCIGDNFISWSAELQNLGVCPGQIQIFSLVSERELSGESLERKVRDNLLRDHFRMARRVTDLDISHDALNYLLLGQKIQSQASSGKSKWVSTLTPPIVSWEEWILPPGFEP